MLLENIYSLEITEIVQLCAKKLLLLLLSLLVTVNESQMEIPAERGQDLVWRVEQRNKKTYLKFDAGGNVEY